MRKIFTKFNLVVAIFLMSLVIAMPVAHAETFSLNYDDNGNLIDGQYLSYVYNEFNQLIEVHDTEGHLIEEYAYDHEGNRIKKVEHFSDSTSETTYYPFPEQVRKVGNNGTEDTYYYFLDGETIARDDPDGSRKYYHNDHLGSHTVVTDDNGAVVEETEYLPYGKVLSGGDADFLYNGKEQDSTNLLYYGARYYDSEMRQFTQPDTIIANYYDPQNLNRYSYVLNNPYKYTDPDGHIAVALMGIAVGATYLAAYTSPYWMPYIGAYFTDQDINDVQTAVQEPSAGNVAWGALAGVSLATPGVSETQVAKKTVSGVQKAFIKFDSLAKEIVGSSYNKIKPTQVFVSPKIVEEKIKLIQSGGRPLVRISEFGDDGKYVTDGHHSFVAYQKEGIPLEGMRTSTATFVETDKSLFQGAKFQDDWSNVKYNHVEGLD